MCVELSTGAEKTYKDHTPKNKLTLAPPAAINCQELLSKCWSPMILSPIQVGMFSGLISCRSYVDSHGCCDFMRALVMSHPGATTSQHSSSTAFS